MLTINSNILKLLITTKHYDWALLNNRDIRDKYVLELRNRFETLREKEEKIPQTTNMRISLTHTSRRHRSVFQQNLERNIEPHAPVKTAPKSYRKNPTIAKARILKKAQYQLAGIYLKEQTEFIQNQIDKIRDSVEDRKSRIAWQTINEVSRRKSTAKAKLKRQTNKKE